MVSILVVDDEESPRRAISRLLKTFGYSVEAVGSVDEALQQLIEKDFDIIVTDLDMHPKNGRDLIEGVRAQKNEPVIPIILYTGRPSDEFIVAEVLASFDKVYYLLKLVDEQVVHQLVKAVLAGE